MISKTLGVLVLSLLCLSNAAFTQDADPDFSAIIASYNDVLLSGGDQVPVMTSFFYDEGNNITGTYTMFEADREVPGVLSDIQWESSFVVLCHWTDEYGTGSLRLLFDSGYSRFYGFWGPSDDSTDAYWGGVRMEVDDYDE